MDRSSTCCTQDTLDWEVLFMKPLKFKITFFYEKFKEIIWIKKKNDYKTYWWASVDETNWIEVENMLIISQNWYSIYSTQ